MNTQNPTQTKHASYYDFKGLDNWYEIFDTGTHVASNGKKLDVNTDFIDQVITNSEGHDIPLVIGHPKHNDPSYGWSKNYKREGSKLFTRSHSYAQEFSDAVKHKHFPKRSISLVPCENGGYKIRHIGFLGAVAPAVKTLADIEFAENDHSLTFDFSMSADERREVGFSFKNIAGYFRRLKNSMIEKTSLEEADNLMPEWELNELEDTARSLRQPQAPTHSFSEQPQPPSIDNTGDTSVEFSQEQAQQLAEENEQLKQQVKDKDQALSKQEREHNFAAAKTAATELITPLLQEVKLLPAQTRGDGLVNFMARLKTLSAEDSTFEFSEADGDTTKQVEMPLYDFAANLIAGLHPQINLGRDNREAPDDTDEQSTDFYGHTVDADNLAFTRKAKKYAAENSVDFATAVKQLELEQESH